MFIIPHDGPMGWPYMDPGQADNPRILIAFCIHPYSNFKLSLNVIKTVVF
jgi:hypothetical protein